ncbi:hypothetical protein J3458_004332 [Metarhizium acridum]|uniref:uncharacterized protein n=1 Tax=Metarhizium acridum TaxID=92637 RepID=UPI001C6C18AF|nr:hypothetical protein J3458_004332 [Metarhizium acridum]
MRQTSIISGPELSRLDCLESSPAIHVFDPEIEQTRDGTPRNVLMNHFQYVFLELQVIGTRELSPILSLGLCRPFLMDSIFAVSASHLRFTSVSNASHRVAEHFQQALAIKNFQGALASPLDQQTG